VTTPWLENALVDELCEGLTQDAANIRFLRSLGLTVKRKPCGRPLVLRSNVEAVLGGMPTPAARDGQADRQLAQPGVAATILQFGKKGR
jgi:hypothetical protein